MEPQPSLPSSSEEEPPPIFRTWVHAYMGVLVYWAFLLLTLYLISRAFTY